MLRMKQLMIAASVLAFIPVAGCGDDEGGGEGGGAGERNTETGGASASTGGTTGDTGGSTGDGDTGGSTADGGTGGTTATPELFFNRIGLFHPCEQIDAACNDDTETVAEIVAATADGNTLVYTDAEREVIGIVDITDVDAPAAIATIDVGGEPTSVSIKGNYALVGVNESSDYVNVAGSLKVYDITSQAEVADLDLGGQPDSIAISPDGDYAVVVLENERDEDLDPDGLDGGLPQLPAGELAVVDISAADAASWDDAAAAIVDLTGLTGATEPTDPEPEFVSINSDNIAVVTLQENNAIALVDIAASTPAVTASFSAGTVDLTMVDDNGKDGVIDQTASIDDVPREPDGVVWISNTHFVTADEGDWNGGSRGFTIFDTSGNVVFAAGNELEHLTAAYGHYPEARSHKKGNEPENVAYGEYDGEKLLFVNSERSSLVLVYDVADPAAPIFKQALPASVAPEGGLTIPSRDLLVIASEADVRGAFRSALNLYEYGAETTSYPTLISEDRDNGTPIPWSAMSGLAAGAGTTLYAVEDSFYGKNRILTIDTGTSPAVVTAEMRITDTNNLMATMPAVDATCSGDDFAQCTERADVFDELDRAALVNDDNTVNIDPEGVAVAADGGFWVVSEGSGTANECPDATVEDEDEGCKPVNSLNMLLKTDTSGVITKVVTLPDSYNDNQLRFGFEGVAEYDGKVYVAFQRTWSDAGVADGETQIGIYDPAGNSGDGSWIFVNLTLDAVASQDGGWVGLSEIVSQGDGTFLIVERDNKGGPDAAIKRLYEIDLSAAADDADVGKTLVRDIMSDLEAASGQIPDKVEGCAIDADGNVWIVNDNDGVDDNNGETQLLNLGTILD